MMITAFHSVKIPTVLMLNQPPAMSEPIPTIWKKVTSIEAHVVDRRNGMGAHDVKANQINYTVYEEQIAAQTWLDGCDGDFDAHGAQEQCLVNGGADAIEKHREIKITLLVRGIHPTHQHQQHQNQPRHGKHGNAIDDVRLTPDETIQPHHHAHNKSRNHADGTFPFCG